MSDFRGCRTPSLGRELLGGLLTSPSVLLLLDLRQLLLSGFPGERLLSRSGQR